MNVNLSTIAAEIVRTSQSLVSLTTQLLVLVSGRCHHPLAPKTAVAMKVSGEKRIFNLFLLELILREKGWAILRLVNILDFQEGGDFDHAKISWGI